ncbi:MAG TPA: sigma factor [Acidimicrobiales bacterium]
MARISRLRDHTLVRRAQQGDRRAFLALLERYDARLRDLAYGLLVDARRVDNAMRLAYVKAWRDVVRIDPKDDAGTWLYRCVYNAGIDELRREIRPAGAGARTSAGAAGPSGPEPVSITDRATLAERTTAALRTLSPEQRVAVVLVDREGFGVEAAARIQGLGRGAVTARLATSRRILAEHVGLIDIPDPDSTTPEAPSTGETAADEAPMEDEELAPVDEASVDGAPVEEPVPLDETPDEDEEIGLAPVDGERVEGERVEGEPARVIDGPVEGGPVEKPAAAEGPVEGERVEGEPVGEAAAADAPVESPAAAAEARVEEPAEAPVGDGPADSHGGEPEPDGDGASDAGTGIASEAEPAAGDEASPDREAGRAARGTRVP